ncbi:MAG: AmmeMemoRadiSam system radical SAM enzyme [Elusimicrobiota bacterium]
MRKEALLYNKKEEEKVLCRLCSHFCLIEEGKKGKCSVRLNSGGVLYSLAYGRAVAECMDPIEKKPLYHFLPGTKSYSVAAAGCNFSCPFCQNYSIAHPAGDLQEAPGINLLPGEIVSNALKGGAESISYTYTEPTIFFEYAYDTAKIASDKGIANVFVSNGYMSPQALDLISPFLDAANIDLKFSEDETYRRLCGARLRPVLNSIKKMKSLGIWVEITTLIIPGENDSPDSLKKTAGFIASIDREIPWHISRFFPRYKYSSRPPAQADDIWRALKIGKQAGLKFIYPGNIESDYASLCPGCGKKIREQTFFKTKLYLDSKGCCKSCGRRIPGIWNSEQL